MEALSKIVKAVIAERWGQDIFRANVEFLMFLPSRFQIFPNATEGLPGVCTLFQN